ncbi:MAG TPA: VOC family protein [Planctomycetota bacterium]|nr:VOC family protein [Planctomycetota bacterium]
MAANPIPSGHHTLTPYLIVSDAAKAIEFYKKAFGAEELFRSLAPGGRIMHARLKVGDSVLMLSDEFPQGSATSPQTLHGTASMIHMYVPDADAVFLQSVAAGATVRMPMLDAFWGDRYGQLADPFGHLWSVATHKEDVSHEEIEKRAKVFFENGLPVDAGGKR